MIRYRLPRTKKEKRRERRAVDRAGLTVEAYRAEVQARIDGDRNSYRRRKRAQASAQP